MEAAVATVSAWDKALGVGTLVVKPYRHCLHVGELSEPESLELGPLLARTSSCVQQVANADQVYVCLWSHAGWSPAHIHFIVQPSWTHYQARYSGPGPTLQSEQFIANDPLPRDEVEAFCAKARAWTGWAAA